MEKEICYFWYTTVLAETVNSTTVIGTRHLTEMIRTAINKWVFINLIKGAKAMKRLIKSVNAATVYEDKCMFTPTDVVNLLKHIEELKNYDITLTENREGTLEIIIGESIYQVI